MTVSAVLQTSFLGDMILTTPLLERLAREGPVHVVATPANAGVLANHPAVASIIVFDKRGADRGWRGMRRVARALRATGATRAYLAQGSMRTAALAWLAGIGTRIGFDTSAGRLLYTRRVPYDGHRHHAVRLWQLASAAGSTPGVATAAVSRPGSDTERIPTHLRPSLVPGAADLQAVNTLLAEAGITDDTPLIALAPGSVWATKRWPSYDALAAALIAGGLAGAQSAMAIAPRLVVLGAAGDAPLAAAIDAAVRKAGGDGVGHGVGHGVIDATGRLSLLGSAALLARCQVLITNDSAPLHLASAMNTPTVALFGPTVPALGFGPLADRQAIVQHETLECRPCHAHGPQQCPLTHWRCMRELSPIQVARAVADVTAPGSLRAPPADPTARFVP